MLPLFTVLAVLSFCGGSLAMPSDRAMEGEEPTDRLLGGDHLTGFSGFPFYITLRGTYFWACSRYRCPALLYDRYTLITTAQCILGSLGTYSDSLTASCGRQLRRVDRRIFHPELNFSTTDEEPFLPNDIGLMYVDIPFDITDDCQRVQLPTSSDADFPFEEVEIIGYNTNVTENTYNEPSEVRLTVQPQHYCQQYFGVAFHPDIHICLKDPEEQQAACFNDHSTPAILDNGTVVGLGSWIYSFCAYGIFSYPSVYVRTAHYVEWFEQNSGEAFAEGSV